MLPLYTYSRQEADKLEKEACLDRKDILAIQKGEWGKVEEIWQRYQPLFKNLIKKYGQHHDLWAEMRVIFIQLLLEYDSNSSVPPAGYLKNKVEKRVFNYLRKVWQVEKKEVILEEVIYSPREIGSSSASLKDLPWTSLTSQQKEVIELIFLQGYSEREVAKILRISPSRVNRVKKLALIRLRRGEQT